MPKNIVICCDGTNNEVTTDSTNVLRLFQMLVRDGRQLTYYDAGVGTLADPQAISGFRKFLSRKLDGAIGHTIRDNFCKAYRFLVRHYEPDDRIFLFGFSRGAYTVRAVAGAIHFFGLLRPELEGMAELGWSIYAGEDKSMPVAQRFGGGGRFCSAFAVTPPPRVHFVGVWDTVSSFGGFANPRSLLYTADNPSIDHVRHALAIDEHRAAFRANLFRPSSVHQHQSIKQVWFAGVHSDVGGGYPEKRGTLSKVSLEWMLRESAAHGLIIDPVRAAELINSADHPPPAPLGEAHESLEGLWWAAEFLPHRSWDGERQKVVLKSPNFGRRRRIFTPKARDEPTEPPPVLHKSVVDRLASTREPKYRPTNLPGNYVVES